MLENTTRKSNHTSTAVIEPDIFPVEARGLTEERAEVTVLSADLLRKMNAYWRAANYLSVGQIYLYNNPLLKEPLKLSDVKPLVVGHWGTTPGQNFIYVHLNRVIKKYDLDMFYIAGPGHGGPALVGNTYLEGSYTEIYPNISQDEAGLKKLFTQFSHLDLFTKAVNWVTRSATLSERRSTIPA
jgi:phosphoketolase